MPLCLDMSVLLAACVILASACATCLAVLWPRFRQRRLHLHKIPGPLNPSLFWGNILFTKDRSHVERNEQVIGARCTTPMPFHSTKDYTGHMEPSHVSMDFWGYVWLANTFDSGAE